MKTTKKILILATSLVILTGSLAPALASEKNAYKVSETRLNQAMNALESDLRYEAPENVECLEWIEACERVEWNIEAIEAGMEYHAPAAEETEEVAAALARLETIAEETDKSLVYMAPGLHYSEWVAPEIERLDNAILAAELSLRYNAPAVETMNEEAENPVPVTMFAFQIK